MARSYARCTNEILVMKLPRPWRALYIFVRGCPAPDDSEHKERRIVILSVHNLTPKTSETCTGTDVCCRLGAQCA